MRTSAQFTSSAAALESLTRAAAALRSGEIDAALFAQTVADAKPLIDALPPAYDRAMSDLVTRLESSALFGGESCSFSHTDLYDALDHWLTKVRAKLEMR